MLRPFIARLASTTKLMQPAASGLLDWDQTPFSHEERDGSRAHHGPHWCAGFDCRHLSGRPPCKGRGRPNSIIRFRFVLVSGSASAVLGRV